MDIVTLANVSGVPLRRLRYVLEHGVLPYGEKASRGRRITRSFTGYESFGIALAGALLDAGQRRSCVADAIAILAVEPSTPGTALKGALFRAYGATGRTRLEIGDGVNVRVHATGGYGPFDTGWLQAATGVLLDKSYSPFVTTSIDVSRLSGPIRKAARE